MGWQDRFSLTGRRAFVTGASKGIGAEICAVFAEAGCDIIAVARDEAGLAQTALAVRNCDVRCLTLVADMATPAGPRMAAEQAIKAWGGVDILVNSAGVARIAPATELSAEWWDETMAVNLRAPFMLAQALAPGMIAQGHGKIINISSQTGVIGPFPRAAGLVSALAGFSMSGMAFVIGLWLGHALDGTARPFALGMACAALATVTVAWTLVRRHGERLAAV